MGEPDGKAVCMPFLKENDECLPPLLQVIQSGPNTGLNRVTDKLRILSADNSSKVIGDFLGEMWLRVSFEMFRSGGESREKRPQLTPTQDNFA